MDGKKVPENSVFFPQRQRWAAIAIVALAITLSCVNSPQASAESVGPLRVLATAPSTQPATAPSAATQIFDCAAGHFRIAYSAGWHAQTGTTSSVSGEGKKVEDTTVLILLPAGAKNDERCMSVDLPELPPHIPGLIPLGMVASGYISDLRKQHPELKVEESDSATVPDARARHVRMTWKEKDRGYFDMAVLIVHKDQILIFSADGDADGYEEIRKVFDSIVLSIKWLK